MSLGDGTRARNRRVVVAPAGAAPAAPGKAAATARGSFAGQVEIRGGRKLYLECRGSGSPTVLRDASAARPRGQAIR